LLDGIFLSAGELPPGNILSLDFSLIINGLIHGVIILAMILVVAKVLYNPVKKFMADRAGRITGDIESARVIREQATEIKADYQGMRDNIEKEKEEILSEARREAVKKSDRILFDAQEEAKDLIIKAKDDIRRECERADADIKAQVTEVSALIAGRFIEFAADQETQAKFTEIIEETWADWGEKA
jgi:F-type H+-transporting ATPase subunit b